MFPLIALGAVIAGAFVTKEVVEASSDKGSRGRSSSSSEVNAVRPQNYVLVPLSDNSSGGRSISAVDSVRNFIF